jgi:uncharacterized damage-inducible protein DinB
MSMTADQATALRDVLTGAIESEAAGTRKVITNITKKDYKPDPKSRSAWEIATHLAMSDVWFAQSIVNGQFAWTGEPPVPAEMTDPSSVAKWHEKHLGDGLRQIRAMTPEQLLRPVEFFGMTGPAVTWLVSMNNHGVHHRGQLAAYLRPMGSKVPAIYGMSADEPYQPA